MRFSDTRVRFSDAPVRFSAWPPERLQKNDVLKNGQRAFYVFGCSKKLRHPSFNFDILLTGFQLLPPLAGPPCAFFLTTPPSPLVSACRLPLFSMAFVGGA